MTTFEKGDKVKILRKAVTHENGWKNSWESDMDDAVGKIGTVTRYDANEKNVQLSVDGAGNYGYPTFVLEPLISPPIPQYKVGDRVKILRKAKTHEDGWKNAWVPQMDKSVGKTGVVTSTKRSLEKDIQVTVCYMSYGYPSFVLELVPATPTVTIDPQQPKPEYKVGDRVEITYGYGWNGPGTVTEVYGPTSKYSGYLIKKDDGRVGGFGTKDLKPLAASIVSNVIPFAEQKPVGVALKEKGIARAVKAHSKVFGIAKAAAIEAGKELKFVHIGHVQEKLTAQGYKPEDLGNAAGGVFRSKSWRDTGKSVQSSRSTSRARKITVWEYIGEGQHKLYAGPLTTEAKLEKYIIEYKSQGHPKWRRSRNQNVDGKNLYTVLYTDVRKANDEALRQMKFLGVGYEYRVTKVIE
jgi:hypothetical protein